VHRSALPGVIVSAVGVACLAFTGGLAGVAAQGHAGQGRALLLLGGLVAVIAGIVLLAPLTISVLAAGAGPRMQVAVRIALRDLVRYRARSGAALAAVTFAVFLAMGICLVASARFDNPLSWTGPNLSGSQLIISTQQSQGGGTIAQLSSAQTARLGGQVGSLAASLHTRPVPLESTGATLYQVGTPENSPFNFTGTVYVATPQLLAAYGIKASQIATGTGILTMRPGLAGLPHLEMTWSTSDIQYPGEGVPGSSGSPPCTLSNGCVASPAIQTVGSLPGGTSAPNTVITEDAVSKYHLQPSLNGWLVQAPAPLTDAQINAARQLALAYGVTAETKSSAPGLGEFAGGATALGIVIAFGVLAASVGLIRSETARDLRTLTATGASAGTRRMITAATAAALGLLGAILGMAGALVAGLAWAHSSLSAMFGGLPLSDVLILLAGLPLVAAAAGWLLAGREPEVIARQPLD
jgi:putative ABC transport system permease protein